MNLSIDVSPDFASGVIVLTLSGELSLESVPRVRLALLKCFVHHPDAVVVDLADARMTDWYLLTVFPTAVRTDGPPTTALVLCGAPRLPARNAGRVLGGLDVYETREQALSAIASTAGLRCVRRRSVRLTPVLGAPRAARAMVRDACRAWGIDQIWGPATLVISELVSNAVRHAGTEIQVTAACPGDYLHLSVQDGCPRPPVPRCSGTDGWDPLREGGRGLSLVDIYATRWGSSRVGAGKSVWALLRATPLSGASGWPVSGRPAELEVGQSR